MRERVGEVGMRLRESLREMGEVGIEMREVEGVIEGEVGIEMREVEREWER